MELNEEFYNWRKKLGITQAQAAARIGVGRTPYIQFEKHGIAGATNRKKFVDFYETHIKGGTSNE